MRGRPLILLAVLLVGCTGSPAASSPAPFATAPPAAAITPSPSTIPATEKSSPTATLISKLATAIIPPTSPPCSPLPAPCSTYTSQPGDTLAVIARHFRLDSPLRIVCIIPNADTCPPLTDPDDIETTHRAFDANRLLPPGTRLIIPVTTSAEPWARLLPDSEVVFSAAGADFDTAGYLSAANGYLAAHRQYLMMNGWNTAADVINLVALENSINPRLLVALLEYQCQCVRGPAEHPEPFMGAQDAARHDLYGQLVWAVFHLSNGYYGWRAGTLTGVTLTDGTLIPLNPNFNAGTAALYNLFAQLMGTAEFTGATDPRGGFASLYQEMFGDPWLREISLFPAGTASPSLTLPFAPGMIWSYTGGPHPAFEGNGPLASLDFAPASAAAGCLPTTAWVTAVADGLVVRSGFGLVIQDLDGDGSELTGWNIMYLHIGTEGRVAEGTYLKTGDRVGQPSCEGGRANGTHLHIARKLNGEWIPAGSGPLPFNLAGWIAGDGAEPYQGTLARKGVVITACTCSWRQGWIENE